MKKIILIITFFLLTSCNNKVFISGITTRGTYILYAGVDNIIEIRSNSNKEIIATIDNGTIEKMDSKTYSIVVENLSHTILKIKQGSNESKFEFRTKLVPNPDIYFRFEKEYSRKNKYSTTEFRKLRFVVPMLWDFDHSCLFEIVHYDVIKIKKNGARKSYNDLTTNNFPNYISDHVESGDIFLFSNIEVKFIGKFEKLLKIDDVLISIE